MSDHEIVTQHFDDPIGSLIHVDGKCYVKISNKTDMIDTPVATDQNSVYYKTVDDCKNTRIVEGRMLCPPKNVLLFSASEASMQALMSYDIPSQSIPPTSVAYVPKPVSFSRSLARVVVMADDPYVLPTHSVDTAGNDRPKSSIGRSSCRATIINGPVASITVINKMLHK